jgi:AcrR family transcriptional regulator
MSDTAEQPAVGRREQRKRQTRAALLRAAEELFTARGYDEVTVAEIASQAGVSVKTLFQHFRSKEDLLFGEEDQTCEQIIAALRNRDATQSALDAVTHWLLSEAENDAKPDDLEGYHRSIGTSPAIASRLRRLWENYETAIARELADENNEAVPTPTTRLIAAQLTAMIRITTSDEVRQFVDRHPTGDPATALQDWITNAADSLRHGLKT